MELLSEEHDDALVTRGHVLDHCAKVYDSVVFVLSLGQLLRWCRRSADALELSGDERVLDIGCGTGLLTEEVAARLGMGGDVVGIDASREMLKTAQRKRSAPNCRYEAALAERLPFPPATFDAVCSSLFFHHVDAELKLAALREAARVLRPGGRLVVCDLGPPNDWLGRLARVAARVTVRNQAVRENIEGLLPRLMAEAGYRQIEEVFLGFGLIHGYRARRDDAER